jgi:methyl-accepting chemotaxis protein
MKLQGKILATVLATGIVGLAVGLASQLFVLRNQGVDAALNAMRGIVASGEEVRVLVSRLNHDQAFRTKELVLSASKSSGPLQDQPVYNTIPVVAAWKAIGAAAGKEHFEFRVVRELARNKKNLPTDAEKVILHALAVEGVTEYRATDKDNGRVIFARPIVLTADCLNCHGDPSTSATKDGKDPLGFQMEGWKEGELRGAFILSADLQAINSYSMTAFRKSALSLIVLFTVTVLVWTLLVVNYTHRSVINPLQQAINSAGASAEHQTQASLAIAEQSQKLSDSSSSQAAALEQTSATLEEMTSMVQQNATHADQAKHLAENTQRAVDAGIAEMAQLTAAMAEIKGASGNIAGIIRTIDQIAFQTNILALNAAVEAARAGEAGAGFAVVAEEVRALAKRSADAAKSTAEQIEAAVQKSDNGAAISARVAGNLDAVAKHSRESAEIMRNIAVASKEQAVGVHQLNETVSAIDKATQANAEGSHQGAEAALRLKQSSLELSASVEALAQIVGELAHRSVIDKEQILKAVGAHGQWKRRLDEAIESGQSDVDVATASRDDACAFGKWLGSLDEPSRSAPRVQSVCQMHRCFHHEAGKVLELALKGQQAQARKCVSVNGSFSVASAQLTKEMDNWLGELTTT